MSKKDNHTKKHQFAFYLEGFSDSSFDLRHHEYSHKSDLYHRIVHVLRLDSFDKLVLFDRQCHSVVEIVSIDKKKIVLSLTEDKKENSQLQPRITFLLPVLKREALHDAIYSLAEMGASEVQLLYTDKSQAKKMQEKELQKLQSIVIAAAEQSKQYAFPIVYAPQNLKDYILTVPVLSDKVVFDWTGQSFFEVKDQLKLDHLFLAVGPEGNYSDDELLLLEQYNFVKCALTNTVLRSVQAVALGCGLFRLR